MCLGLLTVVFVFNWRDNVNKLIKRCCFEPTTTIAVVIEYLWSFRTNIFFLFSVRVACLCCYKIGYSQYSLPYPSTRIEKKREHTLRKNAIERFVPQSIIISHISPSAAHHGNAAEPTCLSAWIDSDQTESFRGGGKQGEKVQSSSKGESTY